MGTDISISTGQVQNPQTAQPVSQQGGKGLAEAQAAVNQANTNVANAMADVDSWMVSTNAAVADLEQARNTLSTVSARASEQQGAINDLTTQLNAETEALNDLSAQLSEQRDTVKQNETDLELKSAAFDEAQTNLNLAQESFDAASVKVSGLESNVSIAQGEYESCPSQIATKVSVRKVDALGNEYWEEETRYQHNDAKDRLRDALERLKAQLQDARTELAAATEALETAKVERDNAFEALKEAEVTLKMSQEELERLNQAHLEQDEAVRASLTHLKEEEVLLEQYRQEERMADDAVTVRIQIVENNQAQLKRATDSLGSQQSNLETAKEALRLAQAQNHQTTSPPEEEVTEALITATEMTEENAQNTHITGLTVLQDSYDISEDIEEYQYDLGENRITELERQNSNLSDHISTLEALIVSQAIQEGETIDFTYEAVDEDLDGDVDRTTVEFDLGDPDIGQYMNVTNPENRDVLRILDYSSDRNEVNAIFWENTVRYHTNLIVNADDERLLYHDGEETFLNREVQDQFGTVTEGYIPPGYDEEYEGTYLQTDAPVYLDPEFVYDGRIVHFDGSVYPIMPYRNDSTGEILYIQGTADISIGDFLIPSVPVSVPTPAPTPYMPEPQPLPELDEPAPPAGNDDRSFEERAMSAINANTAVLDWLPEDDQRELLESGVSAMIANGESFENLDLTALAGSDVFVEANLSNLNFYNANLSGLNFERAQFNGAVLNEADLVGANLYQADFSGSFTSLTNTNLSQANLDRANFSGSYMVGVDLSETTLHGTRFENTMLVGADLSNVEGTGYFLEHSETSFDYEPTVFTGADLSGVDLSGASLANVDLRGVNVSGTLYSNETTIISSDMTGSTGWQGLDLSGVNLQGSNFSMLDLHNVDLGQADLSFANVSGAILSGSNLADALLFQSNFQGAYLDGGTLANVTATDANFSDATIINTNLYHSQFDNANFEGANLSGTSTQDPYAFEVASNPGANFTGANLSNITLDSADWSGANLLDTYIVGATILNTTLDGANFTEAFMDRTIMLGSSLQNSTFDETSMRHSDFRDNNWAGSEFTDVTMSYSDVSNGDWSDVTIDGIDWVGANLRFGNFENAVLHNLIVGSREHTQPPYGLPDFAYFDQYTNLQDIVLNGASFYLHEIIDADWDRATYNGFALEFFLKMDLPHNHPQYTFDLFTEPGEILDYEAISQLLQEERDFGGIFEELTETYPAIGRMESYGLFIEAFNNTIEETITSRTDLTDVEKFQLISAMATQLSQNDPDIYVQLMNEVLLANATTNLDRNLPPTINRRPPIGVGGVGLHPIYDDQTGMQLNIHFWGLFNQGYSFAAEDSIHDTGTLFAAWGASAGHELSGGGGSSREDYYLGNLGVHVGWQLYNGNLNPATLTANIPDLLETDEHNITFAISPITMALEPVYNNEERNGEVSIGNIMEASAQQREILGQEGVAGWLGSDVDALVNGLPFFWDQLNGIPAFVSNPLQMWEYFGRFRQELAKST